MLCHAKGKSSLTLGSDSNLYYGSSPQSSLAKTDILVVTDQFTYWIKGFPSPEAMSRCIINLQQTEVLSWYRLCLMSFIWEWQSDHFSTVQAYHIQLINWTLYDPMTPIYNPRINCTIEQWNQHLKRMMQIHPVDKVDRKWDKHLLVVYYLVILRHQVHRSCHQLVFCQTLPWSTDLLDWWLKYYWKHKYGPYVSRSMVSPSLTKDRWNESNQPDIKIS